MAFLAKKVPKIFPSSKKKKDLCTEDTYTYTGTGTRTRTSSTTKNFKMGGASSLFRKLSSSNNKSNNKNKQPKIGKSARAAAAAEADQQEDPRAQAETQTQMTPNLTPRSISEKHVLQLFAANTNKNKNSSDCCDKDKGNHHNHYTEIQNHYYTHNHNHYHFSSDDNCNDNSDASTLESSPTATPLVMMDPSMISLPDLPKLEFPSQKQHNENETGGGACPSQTNNKNKNTSIPSSLRLVPRQHSFHNNSNDNDNNINNNITTRHLPPPVALVSIPKEFVFPPPLLTAPSCLTRPPPRADEWDDATIESHAMEDDDTETYKDTDHHEQPQQHGVVHVPLEAAAATTTSSSEREKATAQASAIMKPWIERAARLAFLQNRVCGVTENSLDRDPLQQFESEKQQPQTDVPAVTVAAPTLLRPIGSDEKVVPLVRLQQQQRDRRRDIAALSKLRPRLEGSHSNRNRHHPIIHNHRTLLCSLDKGRQEETTLPNTNTNTNSNGNSNSNSKMSTPTKASSFSCDEEEQEQHHSSPPPRIVKWHVVRHSSK